MVNASVSDTVSYPCRCSKNVGNKFGFYFDLIKILWDSFVRNMVAFNDYKLSRTNHVINR